MKIIKKLILTLVVIVAIVSVAIIGGYIYARSKYNIDLFDTVKQLKILSKKVNEDELCTNAFSTDDIANVKKNLDQYVYGLITYNEGEGYEGYSISIPSSMPPTSFSSDVMLSSKQGGALTQVMFYQQTGGKVKVGEKELIVSLMQMDFLNISENGDTDLNVIVKINLKPLKENINEFPFKLLKKYIPNELYISSTVRLNKTDEFMGYEIAHKELKLNNLSSEDSNDFFHTLDVVLKIGEANDLNLKIGNAVASALIGSKNQKGFAYIMKHFSKESFKFATIDEENHMIIYWFL